MVYRRMGHKNQSLHSTSQHPRLLPWRAHCNRPIPDALLAHQRSSTNTGKARCLLTLLTEVVIICAHKFQLAKWRYCHVLMCFATANLLCSSSKRMDSSSFLEFKGEKCTFTKHKTCSIKDWLPGSEGGRNNNRDNLLLWYARTKRKTSLSYTWLFYLAFWPTHTQF